MSDYDKLLQNVPKGMQWIKPPIYVINLANNHIQIEAYYRSGVKKTSEVHADFSNRRLVIADFAKGMHAMQDALSKLPRNLFWVNAFAQVTVNEELLDGLTPLEARAIHEMLMTACAKLHRSVAKIMIYHDGKAFDGKAI